MWTPRFVLFSICVLYTLTVGAWLVFGSTNFSDSDSAAPYLPQIASVNANCVARCRITITTAT